MGRDQTSERPRHSVSYGSRPRGLGAWGKSYINYILGISWQQLIDLESNQDED